MNTNSKTHIKNNLFSESEDLEQLPCRFRKDQISKIREISQANGISQAEVVRRVFDKGMEAILGE